MKQVKLISAILLCAALLVGLATPAFADTSEFTVTADKKMVATGESITLTAVNAPQPEEGQTIKYTWNLSYRNDRITKLLGTTEEPVIQAQVPVFGADYWSTPYDQKHPSKIWCVAEISDADGPVASYKSSSIVVMCYYNLGDSFAVTYACLALILMFMTSPMIVIEEPTILVDGFVYFFGVLWLPFVALANVAEAERVNG